MPQEQLTNQGTTALLSQIIEDYWALKKRRDDIDLSMEIIKGTIMSSFEAMGSPDCYDTPSGLRARVIRGAYLESINVEEARALLDSRLFDKLFSVTPKKPYVLVREVKIKESEANIVVGL